MTTAPTVILIRALENVKSKDKIRKNSFKTVTKFKRDEGGDGDCREEREEAGDNCSNSHSGRSSRKSVLCCKY